jgi:intron-binding protein aquarius
MEGVEHLGKYVYDMQNAKFEALKANGGQLPTREITMRDAVVDEDMDDEENVLIPDEAVDDFEDEDEDEDGDVEVRNTGRHLEVEATSSVQLR